MNRIEIRRDGVYITTIVGTQLDLKSWIINNVIPEGDPFDPNRSIFIDSKFSIPHVIAIAKRKGLTFSTL